MEIFSLIAGIFALLIFLMIIHHFIRKVRFNRHFGIDLCLIFLGSSYLLFSVILFLWSRKTFEFSVLDFTIVYSIILLIQTICLVSILFFSSRQRNVFYSLLAFLTIIPFISYDLIYLHLIIPICFLVLILSFFIFSEGYRGSVVFLTVYSTFSLLSYVLLITWRGWMVSGVAFSSFLFLLFLLHFLEQIRGHSRPFLNHVAREDSPIIHFLKHFVFIIIITNFVFIGTVGVHEIGHLLMASFSEKCVENKIVYELNGFPHTEVLCKDDSSKDLWIVAGLILPMFIAALLFFGGGASIKELSLEIIGFNLAISYFDFMDLGLSKPLASFLMLGGILICALSLALLARSRTKQ